MSKLLSNKLYIYLIFSLIIFLFYGNTLFNGFVFDDVWLVKENVLIREFKNLPLMLINCATSEAQTTCRDSGVYYRPLLNLSVFLTYQINSSPSFFHFINLIYFLLAGILVLNLFYILIKDKILSLVGAILFLINPINSFVVNVSSGINDTQQAIFFILMLITYIKFAGTRKISYLLASMLSYFFCLLAKEGSVFLLFVPIIFGILYGKWGFKREIKEHFKIGLTFLVPLILYLLIRQLILGGIVHQLPGYHNMNTVTSIFTSIVVFPIYLIKLLYPFPLNPQDDFPPVVEWDFRVGLAAIGWLLFFLAAFIAFKKRYKGTFLGLCIIFLSLLPVILFVNKLGRFILADNRLLIASIGFSLIILDLVTKIKFKKILLVILALYFIGSFWVIFNRNKDFKDDFSLNKKISFLSPNNFGAHYNLGVNYSSFNMFDEAVTSYQKAIRVSPDFWQAHYNLANAYLNLGFTDQALREYQIVLKIDPKLKSATNAVNNLLLIKSGTQSGNLTLNKNTISYQDENLFFEYPTTLSFEGSEKGLIITDHAGFFINISAESKDTNVSFEDYLKNQKENFGTLINQGKALIPNFDYSFVKIWEEESGQGTGYRVQKLEFYLFKNDKVVKVVVYPADSPSMSQLNSILGSIRVY